MQHASLDAFLADAGRAPKKGPVAIILVEDLVEVESTLRHHIALGFARVLVVAPPQLQLPPDLEEIVDQITIDFSVENAAVEAINRLSAAAPGTWFYYCFNAEFLFYPFCETRTIGEMLTFHTEERRDAVLSYVIDIYAGDLSDSPLAVSIEDAYLDRSGYYALARTDDRNEPVERQLNFFGGLRWRFEEHIPEVRRRIDRISIFRSKPGLILGNDFLFNDQEYNTYACPWHNNITVAIASFRTAKALKSNSGSTFDIPNFLWHNSIEFEWHSQQLLDLGLMEPGQWF